MWTVSGARLQHWLLLLHQKTDLKLKLQPCPESLRPPPPFDSGPAKPP